MYEGPGCQEGTPREGVGQACTRGLAARRAHPEKVLGRHVRGAWLPGGTLWHLLSSHSTLGQALGQKPQWVWQVVAG